VEQQIEAISDDDEAQDQKLIPIRSLAVGLRDRPRIGQILNQALQDEEPARSQVQAIGERYIQSKPQPLEFVGGSIAALPSSAIPGHRLGTVSAALPQVRSALRVQKVAVSVDVNSALDVMPRRGHLKISVTSREDPNKDLCLIYRVNSDDFDEETDEIKLREDRSKEHKAFKNLDTYIAWLNSEMESFSTGYDEKGNKLTPEGIQWRMKALGQRLYRLLLSDNVKRIYRETRNFIRSIHITTDPELARIPWEIIRPYEGNATNPPIDDDFLCVQFRLTRWISNTGGVSAPEIRVEQIRCIEVGQVKNRLPLVYAEDECRFLADFACARGVTCNSHKQVGESEFRALLEQGRVGLWHIAAHGDAAAEALMLESGPFPAYLLEGFITDRFKQDGPLVFMNVCRAGQQGWLLREIEGWSNYLVRQARCAFIAPL
jgi:hypothetical protein